MDPARLHQLVRAIEGKDLSTAAHTWRVVLYTRAMAEEAGVPRDRILMLTHGAALHDIGKLDTPLEILQKPGRLTPEEFETIKQHTVTGWARLIKLGIDDEAIVELVRHHHERVDGSGYPLGLGGEAIPLPARYFAVIDSFDAMTSVRPYRMEVGPEAAARAIRELREGAGAHYCDDAVEMFARLYEAGRLDFILEHFNDRCAVPEYDVAHAVRAHERKRPG